MEQGSNSSSRPLWTQLHMDALEGQTEAINILISRGANPFAADVLGQTPLHYAAAGLRGINAVPVLMDHICGLCNCSQQQHGVDPSQINAVDPWGRTPVQVSEFIAPFVKFCECHAEAPCVNVADCEGSAVECASGQVLKAVLQLRLDLANLKVEENEDHKLTRIQTYVLQHLLSKRDKYDDDVPPTVEKLEDFVFGSVTGGDVGAICSFPCSHTQDAQEIANIIRLKGDPEGLCCHLMKSSLGMCNMESEESVSMTADVESFLSDLSTFFHQQCPLLRFKWKRVGSSAEDTKTGRPDEYDVMLIFTELSKCLEVKYLEIKWRGMAVSVAQEMAQWSPRQDNITVGVKVKIFQLIADFLAERKSWGKLSFRCLKQFRCGFSAILHLSNTDNNCNIKVDLVPLFDYEGKCFVFRDAADHSASVYESFALRELDHMLKLPPNAREGYMMAKSLRHVHLLVHMVGKPILSDLVDRVLPSYHLKQGLFHAFDQEEEDSLKPHEWAQRIYVQMINEKLTKYFSPRDEILRFSDRPYPKQDHLNFFMQRRRPDLQAFPPEVGAKKYRRLFIDEILKILK